MREFSEIRERIGRLEAHMSNLTSAVSSKGSGTDMVAFEKRLEHVERSQEELRSLLSQYRGALVVLGLIWPFLSDWIKSAIFK